MKTLTLHRHLHPIHWHGSMYLAIAAILVTATKTSGEMLRALQVSPAAHVSSISSTVLRDAETVHSAVSMGGLIRNTNVSGN